MRTARLKTTHAPFDREQQLAWKARRRNAVAFPEIAAEIGRLLRAKARGRSKKTHRFFGEAFVIGTGTFDNAHYGSLKWLTNPRFASEMSLKSVAERTLRDDLHRHFGLPAIVELQTEVRRLYQQFKRELDGKMPTAPDLWLIGPGNRHRFVEVKLPGDQPAPHQLAGMAALSAVLGRRKRVSVELIYLNNDEATFKVFSDWLRQTGTES